MKLRLNRLSNLFRRAVKTACLVLGVLFFVLPVLILLAYGALNPLFFLLILGFNLVFFSPCCSAFPARSGSMTGACPSANTAICPAEDAEKFILR